MLLVSNSSCDPRHTKAHKKKIYQWTAALSAKQKKAPFCFRYLAHSVLKFQYSSFALWDDERFSSSTTLGFLTASPAITTPHSHTVLVHVVASFGLLRFQNPSVAALATNRFGRDIPGTKKLGLCILFVPFQKKDRTWRDSKNLRNLKMQ